MNCTLLLIFLESCFLTQPSFSIDTGVNQQPNFPFLIAVVEHKKVLPSRSEKVLRDETAETEKLELKPEPQKLTPEQIEHRKRILSVGWILFAGVAVLGGILLLFVLVLAIRVRRITRKALPAAPLRDPLGYLKPESKPEETNLTPSENRSNTEPE